MLWKLVAWPITHPDHKDDTRLFATGGPSIGEVRELLAGIHDIICERAESALSRFDSISDNERLGPMIRALEGVAYIIKATQSSGFMPIISNIKDAISRFDISRETSRYQTTNLLTTYIRGMGLSGIPGEFGTHADAHIDLVQVIDRGHEINDEKRGDIDFLFVEELVVKSTYFLSEMHLSEGNYKTAKDILAQMIESKVDTHYSAWAKKKLKRIEKESLDAQTKG
jgi:hypothetical protein